MHDGCWLNKQFHFCEIFDLDGCSYFFCEREREEEEILQCSRDIILNAINLCERFCSFYEQFAWFSCNVNHRNEISLRVD